MIVANDVSRREAGFEEDTNIVTVIDRRGNMVEYPLMSKSAVADKILDHVVNKIQKSKIKNQNDKEKFKK